jgi:hypothetical protein
LVETEAECCCSGILTAMPVELPWWQSITFGATAWRVSMARRQVVESANSALKGAFADLSRGFFRVMGLVKMTALLSFTLDAYNLDRIRSFKAKHGLDNDAQVVERSRQHRAPAVRELEGHRRVRPRSPADVGPHDSRSHKPTHRKGRLQRARGSLQATSPGFEQATAEDRRGRRVQNKCSKPGGVHPQGLS